MQRDLHVGLASARAFQGRADDLLRVILQLPEGTPPDSGAIGELVACAANLAFALELYLKTLLAALGRPVPRHHDLARLFDILPTAAKETAATIYVQIVDRDWVGRGWSVSLAVGLPSPPSWSDSSVDRHLPDVLARSRGAFEAWRYALEVDIPPESAYHVRELEYGGLLAACETFAYVLEPLVEGSASPIDTT